LLRSPFGSAFLRPNRPIFSRATRQKTERNLLSNPCDNSVSHPLRSAARFQEHKCFSTKCQEPTPHYQLNDMAPTATVNSPCLKSMV